MERLERLINLLSALIQTRRPLSRDEIRQRVPGYSDDDSAFRRAFERDKETLRSMGVALITEPLDVGYPEHGDGYRVPPERYALTDPGLTREEMDALALAASSVKLHTDAASTALGKLGASGRVDTSSGADSRLAVNLNDDEHLAQLFAARSEQRTISFQYRNKVRTVDPHRLSFRGGRWYVNGFDHAYEDIRTYRVDRFEGEIKSSEPGSFAPAQPTLQPWLQPWQLGDEQPVIARVLIDVSQSSFAAEQTGDDSVIERRNDGSIVIELEVTNRFGLTSFVLGFLDHAEILEPVELRHDMAAHLRSMVSP